MKRAFILLPFLLSTSCSFVPPNPSANEGINDEEKESLTSIYSRSDTEIEQMWTNEGLAHLMRQSLAPHLTGSESEPQSARLATALTSVGDERFASILAQQDSQVIKRVGYAVAPLWVKGRHDYPLTRKLYQAQYEKVKTL